MASLILSSSSTSMPREQEEQRDATESSLRPFSLVCHVDTNTKIEERKKELEEVRNQSVTQHQRAALVMHDHEDRHHSPALPDTFMNRQQHEIQKERERRREAEVMLRKYRAQNNMLTSVTGAWLWADEHRKGKKRTTATQQPDAVAQTWDYTPALFWDAVHNSESREEGEGSDNILLDLLKPNRSMDTASTADMSLLAGGGATGVSFDDTIFGADTDNEGTVDNTVDANSTDAEIMKHYSTAPTPRMSGGTPASTHSSSFQKAIARRQRWSRDESAQMSAPSDEEDEDGDTHDNIAKKNETFASLHAFDDGDLSEVTYDESYCRASSSHSSSPAKGYPSFGGWTGAALYFAFMASSGSNFLQFCCLVLEIALLHKGFGWDSTATSSLLKPGLNRPRSEFDVRP